MVFGEMSAPPIVVGKCWKLLRSYCALRRGLHVNWLGRRWSEPNWLKQGQGPAKQTSPDRWRRLPPPNFRVESEIVRPGGPQRRLSMALRQAPEVPLTQPHYW